MTTFFGRSLRRTAAGAAIALVATSTALVAAPAGAATDPPLTYNCASDQIPGNHVFTAVIDTNAPATLASGASANITTTATVTVPATVLEPLRTVAMATAVDGTATATGTVDGAPRLTNLAIPRTAVPAAPATTMTLVGTGASGTITGGAAGTSIVLGADNFTATITGYTSTGAAVGPYKFTCTLVAGQKLTVDTVSVVKAPTTVALTVLEPPVEYGEQPTFTAVVTSSVSNAKPAGTVTFTFGGTTITVEVNGGKATAVFPAALDLGMQEVTAVFTPKDPNLAASTTTKAFRVVRDQTTTEATVKYLPFRDRLVAKAKVFAEHGTEVSGSVKFVLKRNGVKIRSSIKLLNQFDRAKKVFRNVDKHGRYTVIARYLGSDTLKRSEDRARIRI